MIKKIKQAIIFSFGAFFAFLFKCTEVSAQMPSFGLNTPAYGTDYTFAPPPTIWEKVLSVVLTPVTIVIIIILSLAIGAVIFIKRKRKNAKKNY